MTRDEGFKLVGELVEAGLSCSLSVGVHDGMTPRENVSVHVHSIRYDAIKLKTLIEIGEKYGLELHLIGSDLRFVEVPEHIKARERL